VRAPRPYRQALVACRGYHGTALPRLGGQHKVFGIHTLSVLYCSSAPRHQLDELGPSRFCIVLPHPSSVSARPAWSATCVPGSAYGLTRGVLKPSRPPIHRGEPRPVAVGSGNMSSVSAAGFTRS
jgi:hypothetical protein